MAARIKKGDLVQVLAGKDKGKQADVLSIHGDRVIVEGVNVVTKAVRPNPNAGEQGGFKKMEASIHISNVNVVNPETGRGTRVQFKLNDNGKKIRVASKDQTAIDKAE